MKNKFSFKKRKTHILSFLLLTVFSFIFFNIIHTENIVEAHYISSAEEWTVGKAYTRLFEMDSNNISIAESPFLNWTAEDLIQANPDRLNWYDYPKHKRYISKIKLVACRNKNKNSFTFPGGFIYMTTDMLALLNARNNEVNMNRGDIRQNRIIDMYNNSSVTFVIAHEMSHWIHEDWLRTYDKQYNITMIGQIVGWSQNGYSTENQKLIEQYMLTMAQNQANKSLSLKFEGEADISAMELVDNTLYMSNGSALTFFKRIMALENQSDSNLQKNTDKTNLNPHPDTRIRYNNVLKYITEKSNGRVTMDNSGRLYFDGKLWYKDGFAPSRNDVTREERTDYTAGMLESLIYKDLLEHSQTLISDITAIDKNTTPNEKTLLGDSDYNNKSKDSNKRVKIVDNFNIPHERAIQIIHNKVKPVTEEEQYLMYYYNFLKQQNHS